MFNDDPLISEISVHDVFVRWGLIVVVVASSSLLLPCRRCRCCLLLIFIVSVSLLQYRLFCLLTFYNYDHWHSFLQTRSGVLWTQKLRSPLLKTQN